MLDSITDMASIHQELPGVTAQIYLNTAAFGPLARCVPQAMGEWLQKEWSEGRLGLQTYAAMGKLYTEARSYAARLLNADIAEIALTGNTGEGLNIICNGFTWQPDDEVILTNHEHISAIILLEHLRDRYGISLRVADLGLGGERPAEEAIARLITPHTRLIVLSHVSFTTGAVLDVRAVGELAHRYNIPVLVDGAQSAGVVPVNVKALGIDFYAFPMQKWLCGPDGTGALYVRHEALERVQPTYAGGWFSLKFVGGRNWVFQDSAQRFELGGRQTAAVAGQLASLRWLEETVRYQWIFERISSLNNYAYHLLKDLADVTVLTPHPGSSGLLAVLFNGYDAEPIARWLQHEHHIYARAIPEHNGLRISTGFYNTKAEIDYLTQVLYTWQKKGVH